MREAAHWGEFPQLLEKAFPGSKAYAIDLPGNGRYHQVTTPSTVRKMAEFVRSVYREMTAPLGERKNVLVSISMGSMVGMEWIHRFPREFEAAVMMNTSLGRFVPFYKRLHPRVYSTLFRQMWGTDYQKREEKVLHFTSNKHSTDPDVIQRWVDIQKSRPVSRENVLRQLWAAARYHSPELPPQIPTLLLASSQDRIVDPNCSTAMSEAWNASLLAHPSAGHDLPLDDSPWVVRQIEGWLVNQPGLFGSLPAR